MANLLKIEVSPARISEVEHAVREPNLTTLLRYSQIAGVHMEDLVNDRVSVTRFRQLLNSGRVQGEHMAQYDAP